MAQNPYAAPRTAVADVPEAPPMERPRVVVIAVILLWTELALGLLDSALDWNYTKTQTFYELNLGVDALFVVISMWINYKIWQGRNWARIVALVLTALAVVEFVPQVSAAFTRSALVSTLYSIELLLDIVALYLVFVPGRRWFARR